MSPALTLDAVRFAYDADRTVLLEVDLAIEAGALIGLIGPNGAGKSTLLRCASGLLRADAGSVAIQGQAIESLPRREIAKRLAFVPQGYGIEFAFTVQEMVAMGRVPHLGPFESERDVDRNAIQDALIAADLLPMATRLFSELSGGERQRVMIARAFAQASPILALDEPNANLDPAHAIHLMQLVRDRVKAGAAAIAALHDFSLAARFCDRIAVLHEGRIAAFGTPSEVMTREHLREVFAIDIEVFTDRKGQLHIGICGPVE